MQIVSIRDNLYEMSNPFSLEKIFIFPRKQDLTLHAGQKIGFDISLRKNAYSNILKISPPKK